MSKRSPACSCTFMRFSGVSVTNELGIYSLFSRNGKREVTISYSELLFPWSPLPPNRPPYKPLSFTLTTATGSTERCELLQQQFGAESGRQIDSGVHFEPKILLVATRRDRDATQAPVQVRRLFPLLVQFISILLCCERTH